MPWFVDQGVHTELRQMPPGLTDQTRRAFSAVAVRAQVEEAAAVAVVAMGLTTHVLFDGETDTEHARVLVSTGRGVRL